VRTPFCLSSDVKIRAGLERTSVSHCNSYVCHTSTAMASLCKMTVLYPGYRIVRDVCMRYKYIRLCCSYTGYIYFYEIKLSICVLSNSFIN
jgi:hypothetical protein